MKPEQPASTRAVATSKNKGNERRGKRIRRNRGSTKFTASEVRGLIGQAGGRIDWRGLVSASQASGPREITQLRQMLRGLERTGELQRDFAGNYYIPSTGRRETGVIERAGSGLAVNGVAVKHRKRLSLRPGDEIRYVVIDDVAVAEEILSHSGQPVVGVLRWHGRYAHVEALGAQTGRIELVAVPDGCTDGDTVAVHVTGTSRRGLVGVVESVIEGSSVIEQAVRSAVKAYEIPDEWPEAVLRAAKKLPKSVQPGRHRDRRDLTDMPLVTIDGATAKDFDDAVYGEPLPGHEQGWRLVVAIADVEHYVKAGSALDREAVIRGTSVYFPEHVISMLPEAISNGLCSLQPDKVRLALVCDMEISPQGRVTDFEFYDAVIHSHGRLIYEEVEAYLERGEHGWSDKICRSLDTLNAVYRAFRDARGERGALDFVTHEGVLVVEESQVKDIAPVKRLIAHQVIEEAMIAANVCAARFLEGVGVGALYRVHEPPDPAKLDELREMLSYTGVHLSAGAVAPAALQKALGQLASKRNGWLYGQLALRTMRQAIYSPDNRGHYGLALERYMHFTSPIRRYPDLVVHRAIKAVLRGRKSQLPSADDLVWLGERCSSNERRAESAGWMVDGWVKCDFLKDRIGDVLPGIIATVTEFGVFVELEGYFVQGLIHISMLGGDYYHFNPRLLSLVGEKSGRRFVIGDQVRVLVRQVEPQQGRIDLVLEGTRPESGGRGRKRRTTRKGRARR